MLINQEMCILKTIKIFIIKNDLFLLFEIIYYIFDKKSIEYENNNNFNIKINKDNVSAEKIAAKYTTSAIDLSFEIIKNFNR